ncbi:hypothetical protein IWX91DRAFT_326010 [Phyllosticta citricarpa]
MNRQVHCRIQCQSWVTDYTRQCSKLARPRKLYCGLHDRTPIDPPDPASDLLSDMTAVKWSHATLNGSEPSTTPTARLRAGLRGAAASTGPRPPGSPRAALQDTIVRASRALREAIEARSHTIRDDKADLEGVIRALDRLGLKAERCGNKQDYRGWKGGGEA